MLHFEEMQVETALLFETIEEIYARVFHLLSPKGLTPEITIRFREYANANSRIKLQKSELTVAISDLLEAAPAPVQEALAYILLAKLFRKTPPEYMLARYRRYLNRADLRQRLQVVKRLRGHKRFRDARGEVYDLKQIFENLNTRYFDRQLTQPELGWSMRPSRTTLGHCDIAHYAVVLSKLLDSESVPRLVVEFVLFHEMLHLKFPSDYTNARAQIHTEEFRHAERAFEQYEAAKMALRQLTQGECG